MFVYSVEGCVGAGKTEFVHMLQQTLIANEAMRSRVCVVEEPVDEWMRVNEDVEVGALQAQYRYPTMYGAQFQAFAYTTHLLNVCRAVRQHVAEYSVFPDLLFVERFPGFSNYHVFLHALFDGGFVDDVSLSMMRRMLNAAQDAQLFLSMVGGEELSNVEFIYISSEFATCMQRVHDRARETTSEVRLSRIHRRYESWIGGGLNAWFDDRTSVLHDVRVIRNDGDIAQLLTHAESLLNAELARTRLTTNLRL
jgi:deoxyadenosine/deoxycytidine kinase